MVIAGHSVSLALLLSFSLGALDAIRTLKDGPMIDAEGREYKSSAVRTDAKNVSGPRSNARSPVQVHCTETSMIILVKADLYKNGRTLSPGELYLGKVEHSASSQCRAVPASDTEYVIEAGLQDCGSKLTISEDDVIYSNKLIILPAAGHHVVTRTSNAVVPVSCHYRRTQFVSSEAHQPPPTLSPSVKYPTEQPAFSLKLMSDDWTTEIFSSVFYLGDLLHLEASYTGPDPRQLFIDSCVATLTPDVTSVPRYYFIENNGCLTDAKQQESKTLVRSRTRADALQLQFDCFLFLEDPRNSIFITCKLKATSEMRKSSRVNKACNYVHSRWENVDGDDDECRCCESSCRNNVPKWNNRAVLRRRIPEDTVTCGTVTLGPLMILPSK